MSDREPGPGEAAPAERVGVRKAGEFPALGRKNSGVRGHGEEETRGRKLSLPDSIHLRLWLSAQERRMTVSAIAAEILDMHLPRFRVERER